MSRGPSDRERFLMAQLEAAGLFHYLRSSRRRRMSFAEYLALPAGYAWNARQSRSALLRDARALFHNHRHIATHASRWGISAKRVAWLFAYNL